MNQKMKRVREIREQSKGHHLLQGSWTGQVSEKLDAFRGI